MRLKERLQSIAHFMQRENITRILVLIVVIVLASSAGIAWFEPEVSLLNGIWWSIVTLTTVGYGDISPVTTGGRIIAVLIMFFGIGLLGMLSGTLATVLISNRIKENKGMKEYDFKDHIIISEWNHRTKAILNELRHDQKTRETPIILIADLEEKPSADELLYFIKGNITEETLERANVRQARTVIVLGDDRLDENSRDAKVVLSTLTIESISPEVYTVVELVDECNVQHCKRAHADEIIVGNELSSHLLASSAIDHGISMIVSELLSTQYGNELYSVPVADNMVGHNFIEIFTGMKKDRQAIVLGIQKGRGGKLISNPPADYILEQGDYMVVVAQDRPY